MRKRKLRKSAKIFLTCILAVVVILDIVLIARIRNRNHETETAVVPVETTVSETSVPSSSPSVSASMYTEEKIQKLRDTLSADQSINSDVVAYLNFKSSLISQPVLLGEFTDEYLYKNWETGEASTWGSIALDTRNNLNNDEMNTIIYGHYVYKRRTSDRTLVFTPLSQLIEQSAYEENKYLSLVLPDEIRYYQIASVYDCPMEDVEGGQAPAMDLQFNLVDYDEDYFNTYLNAIRQKQYYDTGVEVVYGDRLLSLSTCIEDHPESREIVLCKEIGREQFH